jgi:CheY-like chemotaxis protein
MSLTRQTILLVEDDPDDVLLLQRTIQRLNLGKPLQVVSTGELAVAYLDGRDQYADRQKHPLPTLVFLDLKLPGMSGFEVLTWLRQQPRLSRIQVVVLTGSSKSLDVYRAYELGANSYLAKPVGAEELTRLTESLKVPWLALAEPPCSPLASTEAAYGRPPGI